MSAELQFSEENLRKIDELKKRYPTTKALTLPALWIAQEQFGYISQDIMKYLARLLNVTESHMLGVVTFYTMFHQSPKGKYHIEVCTNVSCMLRGADKIVEYLEKKLGISIGQTTPDMKYTLSEVECMGACDTAPMLAVGDDYYENLTVEQIDRILDRLQ
jgi:NADH-quinone oxidoreductase E subunit